MSERRAHTAQISCFKYTCTHGTEECMLCVHVCVCACVRALRQERVRGQHTHGHGHLTPTHALTRTHTVAARPAHNSQRDTHARTRTSQRCDACSDRLSTTPKSARARALALSRLLLRLFLSSHVRSSRGSPRRPRPHATSAHPRQASCLCRGSGAICGLAAVAARRAAAVGRHGCALGRGGLDDARARLLW